MKVGLVIRDFDPRRGGAEVATHSLACWLVQEGCQVHVFARRFGQETERTGVVAHVIRRGHSRFAFAQEAERALRRQSLDVIHDFGVGWYCDIFHPHAGSPIGCQRRLVEGSQADWNSHLSRWLGSRRASRDQAAVLSRQFGQTHVTYIALSRMTAHDFHEYHGIAADRILQIYNGVDTEKYSPKVRDRWRQSQRRALGLRDEEVMLLILAHNFRLKGVHTMIQATQQLVSQGREVRAVIAGRDKSAAGRLLRWKSLWSPRVQFLGRIGDPRPLYAAADIYVHPTRFDNCSLAVMEAMACGLPVVTTRHNGGSELINDQRDGLLLTDPADSHELARRLCPLLQPAERDRMGTAGRQRMVDQPWSRHHTRILRLYEQVASQRRRRAA